MVTLADKNLHEIGYVKDANFTADVNGEYEFSVQIARSNWYPELNFSSYILQTFQEIRTKRDFYNIKST